MFQSFFVFFLLSHNRRNEVSIHVFTVIGEPSSGGAIAKDKAVLCVRGHFRFLPSWDIVTSACFEVTRIFSVSINRSRRTIGFAS